MFLIERAELESFQAYLQERECSAATVAKYMHDVGLLAAFCGGRIADKGTLIAFKEELQAKGYAAVFGVRWSPGMETSVSEGAEDKLCLQRERTDPAGVPTAGRNG